jgi:hypothetical protein
LGLGQLFECRRFAVGGVARCRRDLLRQNPQFGRQGQVLLILAGVACDEVGVDARAEQTHDQQRNQRRNHGVGRQFRQGFGSHVHALCSHPNRSACLVDALLFQLKGFWSW